MIHSKTALEQLTLALKHQGLKRGDLHDEMMDHYLSEIETKIKQGEEYQDTLNETIKKIRATDFTSFEQKNIHKSLLLATFLILTTSISAFYLLQTSKDSMHFSSASIALAPDGWPLEQKGQKISSQFGMREHPIHKTCLLHKGVDIRAQIGEVVLATGSGIIEQTGYSEASGNYIIIRHNHKFSSKYCHLQSIKVNAKDEVQKGSPIGTSGNTGYSLGPHLHYEIRESDSHIDPLKYART